MPKPTHVDYQDYLLDRQRRQVEQDTRKIGGLLAKYGPEETLTILQNLGVKIVITPAVIEINELIDQIGTENTKKFLAEFGLDIEPRKMIDLSITKKL